MVIKTLRSDMTIYFNCILKSKTSFYRSFTLIIGDLLTRTNYVFLSGFLWKGDFLIQSGRFEGSDDYKEKQTWPFGCMEVGCIFNLVSKEPGNN